MKRIFPILVFIGFITNAHGFSLKLKIDNLSNREIYLAYYYAGKTYMLDTARTDKSGYALFKQDAELPQGFYYVVLPNKISIEFILGSIQELSMRVSVTDVLSTLFIEPESEASDYHLLQKFIAEQERVKRMLKPSKNLASNITRDSIIAIINIVRNIENSIMLREVELSRKYPETFLAAYLNSKQPVSFPDYEAMNLTVSELDIWKMKINYNKEHYFDNFNLNSRYVLRNPEFFRKFEMYFTKLLSDNVDSLETHIDLFLNSCKSNEELHKVSLALLYKWFSNDNQIKEYIVKNYFLNDSPDWLAQSIIDSLSANYPKKVLDCDKIPGIKEIVDENSSNVVTLKEKNILMFYSSSCVVCEKEFHSICDNPDAYNNVAIIFIYTDKPLTCARENNNTSQYRINKNFNNKCIDLSSLPKCILFDKSMKILKTGQNIESLLNY